MIHDRHSQPDRDTWRDELLDRHRQRREREAEMFANNPNPDADLPPIEPEKKEEPNG